MKVREKKIEDIQKSLEQNDRIYWMQLKKSILLMQVV